MRKLFTGVSAAICSAALLLSLATPAAGFGRQTESDELDKLALQQQIQEISELVIPACVGVSEGDGEFGGGFSGVVISKDGYVLTAAHAIQPGGTYTVFFPDGSKEKARGLGREPNVDCALMKLESDKEFPFVPVGWSSTLKTNQPCLSISHPGEVNMERGPVVRFGRIIDPDSHVNGFIQSSCVMEPGDSGGPLFDMSGRVIGIHSMVQTPLDENFDVPVEAFRRFWPELKTEATFRSRRVDRENRFGFKMIRSRDASSPEFDGQSSSSLRGVRVYRVQDDSIAARAGLKKNDYITEIDSQRMLTSFEVENFLFGAYVSEKDSVELSLFRDDETLTLSIPVPELQEEQGLLLENIEALPTSITLIEQLDGIEKEFEVIESRVDDYCVSVISKGEKENFRALGTVIAVEEMSLVISKSSQVKSNPFISLADSTKRIALTIVARDPMSDLVLMSAGEKLEHGLNRDQLLPDDNDDRGEFLISAHPRTPGIVSVVGSKSFESIRSESSGFLGIGPALNDEEQVIFEQVMPGHAARKAGFRRGDVLVRIDEFEINEIDDITNSLAHYLPGDEIEIKVLRGEDEEEIVRSVTLGTRPELELHVADSFEGGKSRRRDGFESVFSHDGMIDPIVCGGPVFDLNNRFRGINIARFSRTRCYAIPAKVVRQFVDGNLEKVK